MGIMGLELLLEENAAKCMEKQEFESFANLPIAIDFNLTADYSILPVASPRQTGMWVNDAGKVISHLDALFSRTIAYLEAGIKPVYVFEGQTPALKMQELSNRYGELAGAENLTEAGILMEAGKASIDNCSTRYVMVTEKHIEECKKLLELMGVPVVEAPSEAAAQCAALCKSGKVYAVASEEMDSLAFGAPRFIRNLFHRSFTNTPVKYKMKKVLDELNLAMNEFIDLCILSGCDYCAWIQGIHRSTALKLIRQYRTIENILDSNKESYQIPDDWAYQNARHLFKDPQVLPENVEPELKWSDLDEMGLMNFLVKENGFNLDTVKNAIGKIKAAKSYSAQRSLESISTLVSSDSASIKRKEMVDNTSSNKRQKAAAEANPSSGQA